MFAKLLDDLCLHQAPSGTATSLEEALAITAKIGCPASCSADAPMQIVYSDQEFITCVTKAIADSGVGTIGSQASCLSRPAGFQPALLQHSRQEARSPAQP